MPLNPTIDESHQAGLLAEIKEEGAFGCLDIRLHL